MLKTLGDVEVILGIALAAEAAHKRLGEGDEARAPTDCAKNLTARTQDRMPLCAMGGRSKRATK
jgi:hypothetical protein